LLVLQAQSVPLDQPEELADLVRLRLTANLLQVEELANVRVDEDMVAPACPSQLEPERLDQPLNVGERDVPEIAASDPRKEPPRIHNATLPASTDGSQLRLSTYSSLR